ncbi:MAG: hypothetical protein AAFZ74_05680 [Pseudomonadota bacterium]
MLIERICRTRNCTLIGQTRLRVGRNTGLVRGNGLSIRLRRLRTARMLEEFISCCEPGTGKTAMCNRLDKVDALLMSRVQHLYVENGRPDRGPYI